MRTLCLVITLSALVAASAQGQLFDRADFTAVTTDPTTAFEWVDLSSDGRMDILEIPGYADVRIHTAVGESFSTENLNAANVYLQPGYFAFNDHNGDGDIDIITLKENAVVILDNNPGNGFTTVETGVGFLSSYNAKILWADLNGDLALDIVLGRKIYIKKGASYSESTYLLPEFMSNPVLDDLNGDGLVDIVAGGYESEGAEISIMLNLGEGHFDENFLLLPRSNLRSSSITLLDVDRDSDIDVFGVDLYGRSWIFQNELAQNGNLAFSVSQIQTTSGTRALAGDVNADGLEDLVIASGNGLTVLVNTSTSSTVSFTTETYEQATEVILSLALIDIDLDNDLDIHFKTYSYYYGYADLLLENKSVSGGPVPGVPANLTSTVSSSVLLSWSRVPGTLYNLELKRNGAVYRPSSTSPSGKRLLPSWQSLRKNSSLVLRGLPAGSYQWRLQAISPSGRSSAFTAVNSFTVAEGPDGLTVQASALDKVRLCWSYGGPGSPSFAIFRKTSSQTSTEIGRSPAGVLCFDDNNIPGNERVEYYVAAVVGATYSEPSNAVVHHSSTFVESEFGMTDPNIITARCLPADYDMDGDYDLEFIGRIGSFLNNIQYKNDGTGVFTPSGPMLTKDGFTLPYPGMGPHDIDNDGDPDLVLVTGDQHSAQRVTVFINTNGTFATGFETPVYLSVSQLAVEDMNSDGRLDLIFTHTVGNSTGNPSRFKILHQNKDGGFDDSQIAFVKEETSALPIFKCIDLNSDGFMDILWTPSDRNTTDILVSQKGEGFTRQSTNLPATWYMGIEDYTGDGYIDVATMGNEGLNVYFGNADLTFNEPKVIPISTSTLGNSWLNADIDLNGWPDLVMSGDYGAMVVLNNGNGTFKESNIKVRENWGSSLAITDFENDGDIDMVKLGNDSQHQGFNYFYRNQLAEVNVVNLPPTAPTSVTAAYDSGQLKVQWSASTDDRTPSALLTYNVQITDLNGKVWLSGETTSGGNFRTRLVPGNAGHTTSKTMNDLPAGTYVARVQALDASFALSGWSAAVQVTIATGPTGLSVDRILLNKVSLSWSNSLQTRTGVIVERRAVGSDWKLVGQLPADATSFIDATLEYNTLYQFRVYESLASSTTAISNVAEWNTNMWVVQATDIPNIYGYIDVADFTADGRMDMVLNGGMIYDGYIDDITKATYENTSGSGWVKRDLQPSTLSSTASISFADFNNDFKPDIYQNGYIWDVGVRSEIFQNNGDKTFSPVNHLLSGGTSTIESFFDFDMDNDLDIIATEAGSFPTVRHIYRNNGSGNYEKEDMTACPLCDGIVAVADFDRDGDDDVIRRRDSDYHLSLNSPLGLTATDVAFPAYDNGIAVSDYNSDGYPDITLLTSSGYQSGALFINLGSQNGSAPQFQKLTLELPSGDQRPLFADFDHDGNTDIVLMQPGITMLRNLGNNTFTSYTVSKLKVGLQSARSVDFDNDGDLDIIFGGYILDDYSTYLRKTQVLLNQTIVSNKGIFNNPPESPTVLASTQDELGMHLTWMAPGDDHTSSAGLTYDVVLYREGRVISKGQLDPGTSRRLRLRNGIFSGSATFNNLEIGRYTWRVQAIDESYAGSPLSIEGSFEFVPPPPLIKDTIIYRCGRTVTLGTSGSELKWYGDKELTQLKATGTFHPEQTQTVFVTNSINGVEGIAREVHIQIQDKPEAPTSVASPFTICEGYPQIISAAGLAITWYSDENLTDVLTRQQYLQIPATNATYYVTQTIDECESNGLAILVQVEEIDSEIYSDGVKIRTREEDADYYVWYRNGQYYQATNEPAIDFDGQVATYMVSIQKTFCSEISEPFLSSPGNITAIEEAPESLLKIYPNPTTSVVILKTGRAGALITILDALGKPIYSSRHDDSSQEALDISQWKKGVYTVVISDDNSVYSKRLVVL